MSFPDHQQLLVILQKLDLLSQYGWKARFDYTPEVECKPFTLPRISQMPGTVSMAFRYTFKFYLRKRYIERCLPFIDPIDHVPWRPIYGVPMGGVGCGAIGRGFRGEFCRSSLIPGMYCYNVEPADQFIVTLRCRGETVYQQVLSPQIKPPAGGLGLRDWNWGFPPSHGHYVGLYPRAWTVYEIPEHKVVLICRQISPVIPSDYTSTALPTCVFVWTLLNWDPDRSIDVSITLTWRGPHPPDRKLTTKHAHMSNEKSNPACLTRTSSDNETAKALSAEETADTTCRSATFASSSQSMQGCLLETLLAKEMPCCFGIAAKCTESIKVARCPGFLFHKRNVQRSATRNNRQAAIPVYGSAAEGDCEGELTAFQSHTTAPSAQAFWDQLSSSTGLVDMPSTGYSAPIDLRMEKPVPKLAIAVSASCHVPSASVATGTTGDTEIHPAQAELEFAVVWHSPIVRFRSSDVTYTRRYVRWFSEPGMLGARHLLEHAMANWRRWEKKICEWQHPILTNPKLPEWYKSALFNELYFLTDGGTVWVDPVVVDGSDPELGNLIPLDAVRAHLPDWKLDPRQLTGRHLTNAANETEKLQLDSWLHRSELAREIGLFGYLEGHEYRMYNTYDVHHYASWALIKLWPKLQLALNYDFADSTVAEDASQVYFIHRGQRLHRSRELAVPHDLGDPEDEPWSRCNAYIMFPTDTWKDLNPKFVLQVWRDWRFTQDYQYLVYMLPIVVRVIRESLKQWDSDDDAIIENSGFPDQTYDTWTTKGASAYTGGIWVACLYAAYDMVNTALNVQSPVGRSLQEATDDVGTPWPEVAREFQFLADKAKNAFQSKLWSGQYYAYHHSRSGNHDSIMADQLSGHWFLKVGGAPDDAVFERAHILQTLQTIMQANWRSVAQGIMGAINGVRPGPRLDLSSVQAEEFWVGVNYALGATLIAEGLVSDGFALAGQCYNTIYHRFGLQYQTPEAYMVDGRFRCPGYMRPLAIWSMQHALEASCSNNNEDPTSI